MSSWGFAPRTTSINLTATATDHPVVNGDNIRIWGFIISNSGSATDSIVSFRSFDGTKTYLTARMNTTVLANIVSKIKWIADKGLSVRSSTSTDIEITIFHSHPGT